LASFIFDIATPFCMQPYYRFNGWIAHLPAITSFAIFSSKVYSPASIGNGKHPEGMSMISVSQRGNIFPAKERQDGLDLKHI